MLGNLLKKLAHSSYAHPWRFVSGWVVLLGVLIAGAAYFIQPTSSSISIPGTDAQVAIDRAGELFDEVGGGSGRIVFEAKKGTSIEDNKQAIESLVEQIGKRDGVTTTVSPFVSDQFIAKSGKIAYAEVQFKEQTGSIDTNLQSAIMQDVEAARGTTLGIEAGGDITNSAPGEIIGPAEIIGVVIALMVLVITFGSLIAAGMPILIALVAVGVSMAGLFSLSQVFEISATTPVLAVMLGLAVGIDYALFIINKYRTNLLRGVGYERAIVGALATAGNAVVFAALTVIIALSALVTVQIPFMTVMGLVGAASIAVSAAVALSLTPALMRLIGPRIFGRKAREKMKKAERSKQHRQKIDVTSGWYKWGQGLVKRPIIVLVLAMTVLGAVALPARELDLGLPSDQYAAADSTERRAYDLLSKGFGVGFNAPLTVVVEGLPEVTDADKAIVRAQVMEQLNMKVAESQAGFAQEMQAATSPEDIQAVQQKIAAAEAAQSAQMAVALQQIEANVTEFAPLVQLGKVGEKLSELKHVKRVLPAVATDDGTSGILQVIPDSAPADQATTDLIQAIRDGKKTSDYSSDLRISVTGTAALQGDINQKLSEALPIYLGVIVGLSFLLLVVAFRSILVPIKATLGFLLSVVAMFGALVMVFQWGWFGIAEAPGPIVSFIPIIAIGILFGLAMDYEFFLVSSMHEAHSHGKKAKVAVVQGFGVGARVVVAAAVIMISVFAGFIFSHDATIQSIGFGLAVGILIDAFIVRMTIVPAVMSLLGESAWWLPKWLDKRLPHLSIEGDDKI